jgi:hypothetical protein
MGVFGHNSAYDIRHMTLTRGTAILDNTEIKMYMNNIRPGLMLCDIGTDVLKQFSMNL